MTYLYSLYEALVSINAPTDKARAVVNAMERDMGTTLATKQDLQLLRREMENRFTLVGHEIVTLRGNVSRDRRHRPPRALLRYSSEACHPGKI